jgi:hypothetical protein
MSSQMDVGKLAIYGFCVVFCAIGLGILYGAIVTYQQGETEKAVLMLFAALAFGGFGLGILVLTTIGYRSRARETELRATYPNEPWKWRDDWAAGRVRSMEKAAARFFWVFAILWNLISTPMVIMLSQEIVDSENYAALLGLLFPLVGIGLIVVAARKTIQGRKYGDCLFLMDHVPGNLGGDVKGTIMLPRGLSSAENLNVRLSCIHRERRRSGKQTSTYENVLWQTDQSVARLWPMGGGGAHGASVRFRIPYDASPTGEMDENNSILWRLEADAAVTGVDFATRFEIPVFKTMASSPQNTEEQLRSEDLSASTPAISFTDKTGVTMVPSAGGGAEFVLKTRGRPPGMIAGTGIVLVFAGIAAILAYAGAPLIFPLVFGMFALLIALAIVFGIFGESRIVVEGGNLSIRNSLFGITMGKCFTCSSITKIAVKGEEGTGKRGYYSVIFTQADGKSASPLQFVREKQQADWLANEVRKAMEPWRRGNGASTPGHRVLSD